MVDGIAVREWTDAELMVCVVAYREMQLAQLTGQTVNKTAKRNQVLGSVLLSRSAGSYEFRMSNISAVVEELGLPILIGYQPRRNVGTKVTAKLLPMINAVWKRQNTLEAPTAKPEDLQTRVKSSRLNMKLSPLAAPPINPVSGSKVTTITQRFVRDPNLIAWVLVTADGNCEACDSPAPFLRSDGEPYLEVHHVRPLGEGGPDSADNAVAVCPTCHRRFHHGADKDRFRRETIKKIGRLLNHPAMPSDEMS
ncbi:HNH endonuclease [Rhizobium leguminosarum bv. viciae]|nr:HNH endonuclease [Rhizobium leguminosarum bv. viciae]